MIKRFGKTAMFAVFVFLFVIGGMMAVKISAPYIRKVSPSLADTLATAV
jgi:hypothetical protein